MSYVVDAKLRGSQSNPKHFCNPRALNHSAIGQLLQPRPPHDRWSSGKVLMVETMMLMTAALQDAEGVAGVIV